MTNNATKDKKPAANNKKEETADDDDLNAVGSESFDFVKEEENILAMWTQMKAFETQLKLSENRKRFTFYDGPPFATGLPHYGHILAGTIKVKIS